MTINEALTLGIDKIRRKNWGPQEYVKLDLIKGSLGPWAHFYSPDNALAGNPDCYNFFSKDLNWNDDYWEPYIEGNETLGVCSLDPGISMDLPVCCDNPGDTDCVDSHGEPLILESTLLGQKKEIERLQQWVADLQSGMYVNCVYCGHRYGPSETTPVSMADVLKEHIEVCEKHPMSRLKKDYIRLTEELAQEKNSYWFLMTKFSELETAKSHSESTIRDLEEEKDRLRGELKLEMDLHKQTRDLYKGIYAPGTYPKTIIWFSTKDILPADYEKVWVWWFGSIKDAWYRSDIKSWAVDGVGTNRAVGFWAYAGDGPGIPDEPVLVVPEEGPEDPLEFEEYGGSGDLLTLEEFEDMIKCGGFIDYDGFGELATETHVSNIRVYPSSFDRSKVDPKFTHVCWYNR